MGKSLFEQILDRSITSLTKDDLKGVKKIGSYAFYGCNYLTNIEIPELITVIENNGLGGCGFVNITIPSHVVEIQESAFAACPKLTSVPITLGVDYISNNMCSNCTGLIDITIPDNIKIINASAFTGCSNLKTITITKNVNQIGALVWSNTTGALSITDVYFQQPSGMTVTLPTAGSSTGMFYVKTARSMNVYTDNETIKNYAWSSDNITPTFYHLNGTAW